MKTFAIALNVILKVIIFEVGYCFGLFVVPIMLHACLGVPYIN